MSRQFEKEESARREGMAYAYKIASEKGLDALASELKMRHATKFPIGVPKKELDDFCLRVKNQTIDVVQMLSCYALRDEFDFGEQRLRRFMARFEEKTQDILQDYYSFDDLMNMLEEEVGLRLTIRRND